MGNGGIGGGADSISFPLNRRELAPVASANVDCCLRSVSSSCLWRWWWWWLWDWWSCWWSPLLLCSRSSERLCSWLIVCGDSSCLLLVFGSNVCRCFADFWEEVDDDVDCQNDQGLHLHSVTWLKCVKMLRLFLFEFLLFINSSDPLNVIIVEMQIYVQKASINTINTKHDYEAKENQKQTASVIQRKCFQNIISGIYYYLEKKKINHVEN